MRISDWSSDVCSSDLKVWKGKADEVRLGVTRPLVVSSPRGKYEQLKPTMDVPQTLVAPIAKGQQIGTVKVTLDGKTIASAQLVAIDAVEEAGFLGRLWGAITMWWAMARGRLARKQDQGGES